MFRPPPFRLDDQDALEHVGAVGFGHLVSSEGDGLVTTALPFLLDRDRGCVHAHVARANRHWNVLPASAVLIVAGADGYVSPSAYPSKTEHGEVVPTWNYETVVVHGRARAIDDPSWVEQLVRRLTDHHERDRATPWSVDDAPRDFTERKLRAIVGIELSVDRVEGKAKLSQNRSDPDRNAVIDDVEHRGTDGSSALAAAMRRAAAPAGDGTD